MVRIGISTRLLVLTVLCLAGVSVSPGQEGRYLAVFADARRVVGDELSGWGQSPAAPRLGSEPLGDPTRPLQWFLDRSQPLWNASNCTAGYVEFIGGDRLVGQVTGAEQGDSIGADPGAFFLRVRPAYGREMPAGLARSVLGVSAAFVCRIVWGRQPHRAFSPATLFLRDGGRLRFTAIRWHVDEVSVLLEDGMRRIALTELAELHMPARDPWETYYRELAILNPGSGEALFRLETADGMVLTCCGGRFKAAEMEKPKPRKNRPPANPVDHWYHLVQPAWSADAIWLPFNRIVRRTYFKPHELPLARLTPDSVVQKSMTGFPWRWRPGRNAQGGQLMVGGKVVSGGLGVHANNELTFTLPAFAQSFRTRIALDAVAGRGGCVRGLVYLDSPKSKPLYRSDIIVGSGKILDSGDLDLPAAKNRPRRLILVADAAHEDRPPGADPLDIRDTLDWIDPVLRLDPGRLQAAVVRSVLADVPAWEGWAPSLSGGTYIPMRSQWDASDPKRPRFVHGLAIAGRRLTLTARRRIGPKQRWLKLRVRQIGPPGNTGRIEVRTDGRLAAYLPVCRAGYDSPYLVPLDAHLGKDIKLEVIYRPGSADESIEWPVLSLVETKTSADWTPLDVISAVSQRGVKLDILEDGSILAGPGLQEKMPSLDTYCIRAKTDLPSVTAIRLEALTDPSLLRGGPGRSGRVALSQFRVSTVPTRRETIHGRYVRLSLPDKVACLHVNEVQVFAPPPSEARLLAGLRQAETPEDLISPGHKTADILAILKTLPAKRDLTRRTVLRSYLDAISRNIALGAKASQSTTLYNCKADKAIDGRYLGGGYTHTDQEQSPWWLLDLGDSREIDRVVVWYREDGNGYERMTGLLVEVLDAGRKTVWQRKETDSAATAAEFFDSDARELPLNSAAASCTEGRYGAGASLNSSAYGWSIATRFGEPHAIEFALAGPVDARRTGLDIKLKHAYEYSYATSMFSSGSERLPYHDRRRVATLGCFRLLATGNSPSDRVEPTPIVVTPFETDHAEKADASVVLPSPHALFEDSARFDAAGPAAQASATLVSDDRHAGKHALRIAPGAEYRLNFGRIIAIRAKPIEGEFRYIRFAFRKYGAGRVSLSLGHLAAGERPCRYEAGKGTPTAASAQSVWTIGLPPEWGVLDRDIIGDFGRLDLTSLTIACSDGGHAVLDHVYLAQTPEDFKRLPPAPSPEETNEKARRVLAGPVLKKGLPAVVSIKVGDREATGVIVGEEGYVLTVGHMLIGGGPDASIRLHDGRTVRGKVAGVFRTADVGLVKITDKGIWKGLEISKVDTHRHGGLYVGFSLARSFQDGKTPTSYITDIQESGWYTYRGNFTRKDAIVGGPLLDEKGQVVGVHIQTADKGGMKFARLRSETYRPNNLKRRSDSDVWPKGSGPMLGFYSAIKPGGCGVATVYPDTPAAAAGMKPGDVITHLDNETIGNFERVVEVLRSKDPGDEVTIVFKRGDKTIRKKVRLMRRK